jgi:hypothetical protein
MASIPQVVLNSIAYGQASGPYNGSSTTFSSDQLKGNGYYGYTDGLHTVSYKLTNFVGIIDFQASLLQNPTDSDWFDITTTTIGNGTSAITGSYFFNFTGNFVWCRAHITNFTAGNINQVLYNT